MGSHEMVSRTQEENNKIKINNFATTCNRFSQFLKENRSFGNVHPTQIQTASDDIDNQHIKVNKYLDLFPLTSSPSTLRESASTKDESSSTAKMTIIYDGKVLVYEDLQEEMAQEIIEVASQRNSQLINALPNNNKITTRDLCYLPIARGASLHRFMDKRKERIASNAPYRANSFSTKELCMPHEDHQLELKL